MNSWRKLWCNICTLNLGPHALPFSQINHLWLSQQIWASSLLPCSASFACCRHACLCKQNLKCAQARCQLSEAQSGIVGHVHGEHSGDHNHQDFSKVLRCESEAYCNTNGRRTAIQMGGVLTMFPFPPSVGAPKALQYKLEAYCNTNWRRIAIQIGGALRCFFEK